MNWKFWQKNDDTAPKRKRLKAGSGLMPFFLL